MKKKGNTIWKKLLILSILFLLLLSSVQAADSKFFRRDDESEVTTLFYREVSKNNALIAEKANELVVVHNNEIVTLKNVDNLEVKKAKLLAGEAKPLVELEKIRNPKLTKSEQFIVQVKKNHNLSYKKKIIESDNFDFIVVESNDLTSYLNNYEVIKIGDPKNLENLVEYTKNEFKAESEEMIRKMELKKNVFDVIEIPRLIEYMEEEEWDTQPGQASWYQQFITPTDSEIQRTSNLISTPQEAYSLAVNWLWVSDQALHNKVEKWLFPNEFLANTPTYPRNPAPGRVVSDCSEQANTLVSILRAKGVPAEDVRVVLGKVNFQGTIGGHSWVEIKENGRWMVLDPTCGPYYDEENKIVRNRNGISYRYWKYHPYPVEEIWVYYNDVYFTDENEEVALGWSTHYDVFTEADLYAGIIVQGLYSYDPIIIYVGITIIAIVSLIFVQQIKRKGSKKR
ncbi:MAG: transglutaminase domain-containing protein [Thermoplasmatales archaeon]|nr:transglutaminase domain-containing protein [Thermoplasmatales archaeon]